MKKTTKILSAWMVVFLFFTGIVLAQAPLPISPGVDDGTAVVISGCPTFSWSEVADAASYRVSVFTLGQMEESLPYEDMALLKAPVLEQIITDRGYSWTPSADRCLLGGAYVW